MNEERFGVLSDGTPVHRHTLTGGSIRVRVLTYGCVVQTVEVPGRDGGTANVVLGCATLDDYVHRSRYFGAVVGRYGNRIAGGRFTLDGQEYELPRNNGDNSLHGGDHGFDKRVWDVADAGDRSLTLTYVSPDGEQGYPGTLRASVTYTVTDDALRVDYHATTDRPTVVNLTNHSYFNLGGEGTGTVYDHRVAIDADHYLPVDGNQIPLGEQAPVAGTPFDFTKPQPIGARIRETHPQLLVGKGYDHTFVLNGGEIAARAEDPHSGRVMEVLTSEPGVQFYTGNFLDGTHIGTSGLAYRQGDAFCLETQHFPDSPNQPSFPSTVLRPGEEYRSTTTFRFSTLPD